MLRAMRIVDDMNSGSCVVGLIFLLALEQIRSGIVPSTIQAWCLRVLKPFAVGFPVKSNQYIFEMKLKYLEMGKPLS